MLHKDIGLDLNLPEFKELQDILGRLPSDAKGISQGQFTQLYNSFRKFTTALFNTISRNPLLEKNPHEEMVSLAKKYIDLINIGPAKSIVDFLHGQLDSLESNDPVVLYNVWKRSPAPEVKVPSAAPILPSPGAPMSSLSGPKEAKILADAKQKFDFAMEQIKLAKQARSQDDYDATDVFLLKALSNLNEAKLDPRSKDMISQVVKGRIENLEYAVVRSGTPQNYKQALQLGILLLQNENLSDKYRAIALFNHVLDAREEGHNKRDKSQLKDIKKQAKAQLPQAYLKLAAEISPKDSNEAFYLREMAKKLNEEGIRTAERKINQKEADSSFERGLALYNLCIKTHESTAKTVDHEIVSELGRGAFRALNQARLGGNPNANVYVGICLYYGIGVDANKMNGLKILQQCEVENLELPQIALKILNEAKAETAYQVGLSKLSSPSVPIDTDSKRQIPQHEAEAFNAFQTASNLGNNPAAMQLAICYLRGIGVEKNLFQALRLFKKAGKIDKESKNLLKENLQDIYNQGLNNLTQYNKADSKQAEYGEYAFLCFDLVKELATGTLKNQAKEQLGICYFKGIGTGIQRVKSIELFEDILREEKDVNTVVVNILNQHIKELYQSGLERLRRHQEIINNFLQVEGENAKLKGDAEKQFNRANKLALLLGNRLHPSVLLEKEKVDEKLGHPKQEVLESKILLSRERREIGQIQIKYEGKLIQLETKLDLSEAELKAKLMEHWGYPSFIPFDALFNLDAKKINRMQLVAGNVGVEEKKLSPKLEALKMDVKNGVPQAIREFGDGFNLLAKNASFVFKCYSFAADKGDPTAKAKLGNCYLLGNGVPINNERAYQLFQEAAAAGDALGKYYLGLYLYNGRAQGYHQAEGVKWIEQAANQGLEEAQNALANCYRKGFYNYPAVDEVVRSPAMATAWDGVVYKTDAGKEIKRQVLTPAGNDDKRAGLSSVQTLVETKDLTQTQPLPEIKDFINRPEEFLKLPAVKDNPKLETLLHAYLRCINKLKSRGHQSAAESIIAEIFSNLFNLERGQEYDGLVAYAKSNELSILLRSTNSSYNLFSSADENRSYILKTIPASENLALNRYIHQLRELQQPEPDGKNLNALINEIIDNAIRLYSKSDPKLLNRDKAFLICREARDVLGAAKESKTDSYVALRDACLKDPNNLKKALRTATSGVSKWIGRETDTDAYQNVVARIQIIEGTARKPVSPSHNGRMRP